MLDNRFQQLCTKLSCSIVDWFISLWVKAVSSSDIERCESRAILASDAGYGSSCSDKCNFVVSYKRENKITRKLHIFGYPTLLPRQWQRLPGSDQLGLPIL